MGRAWRCTFEKPYAALNKWKARLLRAQKRRAESCRESLSLLRAWLRGHEQDVGMNSKGYSDEVSEGNKEHVIGNWRKDDPRYEVARSLAELCLCPSVLWQVELWAMKLDIWLKPLPSSVEGRAWLLLNAYSKIQEERNDLETGMVNQKGNRT